MGTRFIDDPIGTDVRAADYIADNPNSALLPQSHTPYWSKNDRFATPVELQRVDKWLKAMFSREFLHVAAIDYARTKIICRLSNAMWGSMRMATRFSDYASKRKARANQ